MGFATMRKIKVMQAVVDGKRIEGRCIRGDVDNDWEPFLSEPNWNWESMDYRIATAPKPSINWDHVAEKFRYLAVDKDDMVAYLYVNKPKACDFQWVAEEYGDIASAQPFATLHIPEGVDWKDSLIERPITL